MSVYSLSDFAIDELKQRLMKVNRKARKLDLPEVTFDIIGFEYIDNSGIKLRLNQVSINYPHKIVINGWRFIAKITPIIGSGLNAIIRIDQSIKVPEKYLSATMSCDHCNINRNRNNVYILFNETTTEYKQVGGNCLIDFIGHTPPEQIAAYLQWIEELDSELIELSKYHSTKEFIDLELYLAHVSAITSKYGFISRTKAELEDLTRTSSHALMNMREMIFGNEIVPLTPTDHENAKQIIAFAKTHFNIESESDYDKTCYALTLVNEIEIKFLGYVAYWIILWKKNLDHVAAINDHFGKIGDVIEFTGKVLFSILQEGAFGAYYITVFETLEKKKALAFLPRELKPGLFYTFSKVEILDHIVYNNEKQTKIKIGFRLKSNRLESEKES